MIPNRACVTLNFAFTDKKDVVTCDKAEKNEEFVKVTRNGRILRAVVYLDRNKKFLHSRAFS